VSLPVLFYLARQAAKRRDTNIFRLDYLVEVLGMSEKEARRRLAVG
jgi:hypothetical protein